MTARLPESMSLWCERCGSRHVHEELFRLPGVVGIYCIAPRSGRDVCYVRVDEWLGTEVPAVGSAAARAAGRELLRRFLHCYGPATPGDFADWARIGTADARQRFTELADDLQEVRWDGNTGSVLRNDIVHRVQISYFDCPIAKAAALIEQEAQLLAGLRGCRTAEVSQIIRRRVCRARRRPRARSCRPRGRPVLGCRQDRREPVVLRHQHNSLGDRMIAVAQSNPIDGHRTGHGSQESGERPQQRRLAGTRWTGDREYATRLGDHGHVVQDRRVSAVPDGDSVGSECLRHESAF
jgi:DNA glycosylase AlkZ-like